MDRSASMQWISEFFAMGGYAGFVWSAYGVTAIVLIGLFVISLRHLKARQSEVLNLEASSPHRKRRPSKDEK